MTGSPLWEEHAAWWQAEFTDGADPEYEEQILPLIDRHLAGARRVLDVGCGEGQLARRAAALGAEVVGLDPAVAQLATAMVRGGGPCYALGLAEHLPYRSNSVDAVVMCLVIEHLEPFEPSIREMARVLQPGGVCLLLLNHPLLQTPGSGWIDDQILEEQYWRVGPYLRPDSTLEEVSAGVRLPFMHRPLSRYVHVMGEEGLLIEDMDEPPPPPGFIAEAWEYGEAATIPRLMLLRARPRRVTGTAVDTPPILPAPPADTPARSSSEAGGRLLTWLRRPVVACLLLLVVYAGLSLALNDPRGTLGTDTGGKLATLHMMERNGGLDPDIGYWAQQYDPKGVLQPLHYTYRVGDKWVNVTTLPMLYAAYPLYLVGGDRGVLLLPMLGGAFARLAARALARRLGGGDGWAAFWIVGLVTPVAIYSLDFWEHTVGLALMLWAGVVLLDVVDRRAGWRGGWPGAVVAGALFGVAATMRTEALVYLVVATGVACLVILVRQRAFGRAVRAGLAALVGAAVPLVLNRMLEQATLGTDLRGSRVAGTATGAGTAGTTRVHEALTTAVGIGLANVRPSTEWVVGALVVVLVAGGAWALTSGRRLRVLAGAVMLAFASAVYFVRFSQGLGFVPGVLAASPFAAVGIVWAWRRPRLRRGPAAVACVALPIAWMTQYSGGADPQWGGRYILFSGTVLAVAGYVVLQGHLRALIAAVLLSGLVTMGGLVWLSVRSHTVADGMTTILARHDDVVISRQNHMLREGGAFYDSRRHWLTAATDAQLADAVHVARDSGAQEFALIGAEGQASPRSIGGYVRGGTQLVPFIRPDVKLGVVTYRLPG